MTERSDPITVDRAFGNPDVPYPYPSELTFDPVYSERKERNQM